MEKHFLTDVNEAKKDLESFQKEKFEPVKQDRLKYYLLFIAVVLLCGTLVVINNQKTTVVDFTNWTLTDTQTWADNHSIQLVTSSAYSDSVATESIISQSVSAKAEVSKNGTIQVTVSKGMDPDTLISVPDFDATWTKNRIVTWLNNNGITNFAISTLTDDALAANTFISFDIPDTTKAEFKRSDTINFVVSTSTSVTTVSVVDFSTYNKNQISAWGLSNDVTILYKTDFSSTVANGGVISQSVATGETVNSGDSITVTLSLGTAVVVPNFTTLTAAQIQEWASTNAIQINSTNAYSGTIASGKVISQSLVSGTKIEANTKIALIYSIGNTVNMASFIGKTLTELQDAIALQNTLGANLKLSISSQYSNNVSVNRVISQSAFDTKVPMGSTIQVIVSLGRLVVVPDFSLLSAATASQAYSAVLSACDSNHITCRITLQDGSEPGKVVSQSIISGSMISDSNFVDIVIEK